MTLSIALLGPPSVRVDGRPLVVDTRKAVALLAFLALARDAQPRRSLGALLWPEIDDEHASAALRRTLSVLRSALGDRWVEPRGGAVALEGPGIDSDVEREAALWRDVHRHEQEHEHGRGASCERCSAGLEAIVALHRGPFLAGFSLRDSPEFDDWQAAKAHDAERRLTAALAALAEQRALEGRFSEAVALARRRLELDPLDESGHRELIRILGAAGDRAAAVRAYRECVRVLDEELAVAPLPETAELYRRIAEGSPAGRADGGAGERPAAGRLAPIAPAPQAAVPRARPAIPFVGREGEMAELASLWRDVATAGGRTAIVEGEPGIGKTRLADEFATFVRADGGAVVQLRCYADDADAPYAALVELFRDRRAADGGWIESLSADARAALDRLVPELVRSESGTGSGAAGGAAETRVARSRLVDGLAAALLALLGREMQPTLVTIDDAQWIDDASAEVVARTARRLASRRTLLLVCRRPVRDRDALSAALAPRASGEAVAVVVLERLSATATRDLVARLDLPGHLEGRLHAASEGLPLYLAEYAAALGAGGATAGAGGSTVGEESSEGGRRREAAVAGGVNEGGTEWLPPGLRVLLESRLALLSESARQVAVAAAVLGRSFDPDVAREVSGRTEEETAAALDELAAAGLIRERRASGPDETLTAAVAGEQLSYDFDHRGTREVAYASIGLARRRLLHARAAEALRRRLPARAPVSFAAAVARHYRAAGRDLDAAGFLVEAARSAERVFANAAALELYRAANALDGDADGGLRERAADLETLLGRYDEALRDLEASIAASNADATGGAGRRERKLAGLHRRRGEFGLAEMHLAFAESALPESAAAERTAVLLEGALLAHRTRDVTRAAELAQRALALAAASDDRSLLASAHNVAGLVARTAGDLTAAGVQLRRSLELAAGTEGLAARVAALNNLALVEREAGHPDEAIALTEAALRACVQLGDRHREAALRNNLADLLHTTGRREASLGQLREAVSIFAGLGEPGELQPEIWRLVEW